MSYVNMNRSSTMYTEEIICPYCGYVERDSWEYDQKDEEYECGECGEISNLGVSIWIKYSTWEKGN